MGANAETEYLLPDGPPDSEESEPEQSEESEPEQSEESEPEPEQSEESEPQPDQSGETETETETESGELSDGAGTGQAVQTHGSSANALSSVWPVSWLLCCRSASCKLKTNYF